MSGIRRRRDPYAVASAKPDPDLVRPAEPDCPWIRSTTETLEALERAWDSLVVPAGFEAPGRPLVVVPHAKRRLVVTCERGHGCAGDRRGRGAADLATVYRTSEGLLYIAEFVVARERWPTYEAMHPDAIVVHNPELERAAGLAPYTTAHWATRRALEARRALHDRWAAGEGPRDIHPHRMPEPGEPYPVIEAPPGVVPTARREQTRPVRIRDLIDRDDLDHVPLRASCSRRAGEYVLDRAKLLAAVPARGAPMRRLPVVRAVLG